jgi:hypothetical protein
MLIGIDIECSLDFFVILPHGCAGPSGLAGLLSKKPVSLKTIEGSLTKGTSRASRNAIAKANSHQIKRRLF